MKATKSFLIAVLFLLAAIPAQAANWVLVAEGDGSQWYVETESIRRIGNTVECWQKTNYEKQQSFKYSSEFYVSTIGLWRYDCFNRTGKVLQHTIYSDIDGRGEVVSDWSGDNDKPSRIIPGTIGEAIMKYVCQRSRQK
jgi:hypothetical protein